MMKSGDRYVFVIIARIEGRNVMLCAFDDYDRAREYAEKNRFKVFPCPVVRGKIEKDVLC